MIYEDAETLRTALRQMPRAGSASVGSPPTAHEIYALPAHASAIDPDVALVIGNRGMGKTFWASALYDPEARAAVAAAFPTARGAALRNVNAYFGFADREGVVGVSSDDVARYSETSPDLFWRGLIIHVLSSIDGSRRSLIESVSLASNEPDLARSILRDLDKTIHDGGHKVLILFDQLDQLADNWPTIQTMTKALLKLALSFKSYRAIRLKIFMRTDQAADEEIFRFTDASKIWGEAARLRWYSVDLYGLLYSWLWRDPGSQKVLGKLVSRAGHTSGLIENGIAPMSLAADPELQGKVFDQIAGDKMGGGSKRGRPYSWIPAHLADGTSQISPRSFMTALAVAAERFPETSQRQAIDFKRIQEGVRAASDHRRSELFEDYPWIQEALEPLRAMTVPAERKEMQSRWKSLDVPAKILARHHDTKAPIEVLSAPLDEKSQLNALDRALEQIGVFEERSDGRVNIPDIFRIAAGIKRRGGITPQQRRRI